MNKLFVGIAVFVFALTSQAADRDLTFTKAPLAFEPNRGQSESLARFLAHGAGYSVKLEASRAILDFDSRQVTMELLEASKSPKIAGEAQLPGTANYFRSSNPKNWFTGIPTYSKVSYNDVYPGVGLAFYGKNDRLEYDFLLDPGADDRQIRFQLSGAGSVRIDGNGDLVLDVDQREFRMLKPVAWQPGTGGKGRETVAAGYLLRAAGKGQPVEVSFSLGPHDAKRALVIDPVLSFVYSEYVGYGVTAVAVDGSGDTYVTGQGSGNSYYVTEFSSTGAVLYTSTFSGASAYPYGLAIDNTGRAYVTGEAYTGLTTTSNAYQTSDPNSGYNTFLSVLSAGGSSLAYATYLGGTVSGGYSWANSVAVDSNGNAYLAGQTGSTNFPTTSGAYQTTFPGGTTGFVAKINPAASGAASLVYSTFLGPNGSNVYAIALDSSGDVYATGNFPTGYPVTPGAFSYNGAYSTNGGVYVTELNPSASALVYSAYLGYGTGWGIAVDGQGSAYVTGSVGYADFPTTSGAYQTTYAGGFVVKLPPGGASETYSTFLGGPSSYTGSNVTPASIAIPAGCASACNAYVSGQTTTSDYPTINAVQAFPSSSGSSGFVTELSAAGNSVVFSTYLSGATATTQAPQNNGEWESVPAVAVDSSGNMSVVEEISGSDFPVTLPGTSTNGVLAKIGPATAGFTWATPSSLTFNSQPVGVSTSLSGGTQTITLRNLSNAAVTLASIAPAPSIFSESDNCNGSIVAGGYCTLSIDFTPAASGQRSGTLIVTSNASNSPAVFALSGTGYDQGYLFTTTSSLNFGDQTVGTLSASQSITITNLGDLTAAAGFSTGTANFQEVNNCPNYLAPGASCTVTVTFIPTQTGLITDYLNSTNYALQIPLSGTGTLSGNPTGLALSATSLNFGLQTVGTVSPVQSVYITNTSSVPVTIQSTTASSGYSISGCGSTPAQIMPQSYCYVNVSFAPTAAGALPGTLTISNSTPGNPTTVSLSGTGQAATETLEFYPGTAIVFPDQALGYPSTYQQVYVYNAGTATATIDRVEATGDFEIYQSNCEGRTVSGVSAGRYSYCYVYVTFSPSALGARTGTLTVFDSATNSPQLLNLSGNGIAATGTISATPLELTYPVQPVGVTSPNQYVYVTNPGNDPVNITGVTPTGDFAITYNSCPTPYMISPGQSCSLYVGFTPTSITNPRTGSILITSSAGNQTVSLSGTGEAASQSIGVTPTALTFGSLVVGKSSGADYVYARSVGTETVTFTANPAVSGTNANDFSVTPFNCYNGTTVSPGTSCDLYVTFTPRAAGAASATLTLKTTAGTQTLALSGNGVSAAPTSALSLYQLSYDLQVQGTTSPLGNSVTFTNNGTSSVTLGSLVVTGNFIIPSGYDTCSGQKIAAHGTCYAYIEFAPASTGYLTGNVAFNTSTGTNLTNATLAGYSVAPVYSAYIDPGALNYGSQVINTVSSSQEIYLYNSGNLPLTVGTAAGTNVIIGTNTTGEFSAAGGNDGCSGQTVPGGAGCTMYVTFTPSATGPQTGSITLPVTYANNSTGSFTATLSGSGMAITDSANITPTAAYFIDQVVGTTSAQNTITLTNSGNLPLTVGTLTGVNTILGAGGSGEFSIKGVDYCSGTSVPSGGACTVYPTFNPSSTGTQTGSITFPVTFADSSTNTLTATLTGNGTSATNSVAVSPGGIQFGNEVAGQVSAYQTAQVTNTGNVPIKVTADSITAPFAISSDSCASTTIQPGSICYVYVTFDPTATGSASGTLTIGDNGAGGPHTVTLSGVGVPATQAIVLSQTTVAFGNQPAGSTGSQTSVYISNESNAAIPLNSLVLGGTNAADFQLTKNNCTGSVASFSSCYFYVAFAPVSSASGSLTATVTVKYAGSGSPQIVTLTGTAVAPGPAVALTPSTFNFPSTNVGGRSAYQLFSVTNTGSANLTSIAAATTNHAEFPVVYDGCSGATLTPQQQCVFAVEFSPTLGGSRSGSINVTDNAAGSPQTITLTGTGIGTPVASVAPVSLSYGGQNLGVASAAQTFSVTNTGSDVLKVAGIAVSAGDTGDFSQTNSCPAVIAPNGSCTVSVIFTPSVAGSRGATITVTDNSNNIAGSVQNVAVSGTGVSVSTAIAAPNALTFSNQNISTSSAAQTVTLTNSGTGALSIASVAVSGTNSSSFNEVSGCGISLPAGSNCTIAVTFTPTAAGSQTATLTITDNANNTTGSTQTVNLSGTGVAVPLATAAPTSLTFASQNVGTTSAAQNVTLTNSGTGPLTIASVALSGANPGDFGSASGCGSTLAAGANCTIAVTFTPTAAGSRAATLTITDNANNTAGSTQTVALSGTGVAVPQAGVAPGSLTFAAQSIGTSSAPQNITLSNGGTGPLTITGIALSSGNVADFSSTNNCPTSLAANSGCTIAVTFTPTASGSRGASITITDNANNVTGSTQVVSLAATGVAVPLASAAPNSLTYANQVVGTTSAAQNVTLMNAGSGPLSIASIAISGTNATSFGETNGCGISLPAGTSCTIAVTFDPTTTGSLSATLTITDNANNVPGATQTVALSGSGIPAPVVTSVSVTPSSGTGTTQTFGFEYSDTDGSADLGTVYALFNTTTSLVKACYVYYVQSSNLLYLENAAGSGAQGSVAPGSTSTVSNGYCQISGIGSSVTASGNNLTVNVNITFKSTFTGAKTIYMNAVSNEGETSGGLKAKGTWTP